MSNHTSDGCYYTTCFSCKKTGHISKVCRAKSRKDYGKRQPTQPVHDVSTNHNNPDEYSLVAVNLTDFHSKPIMVSVNMDGIDIDMELDTAAAVSIMSEDAFRCHWPNKELQTSDTKLKTYSGEPLFVKGTINVQVKYGVQSVKVPLLVVVGKGPTLFGQEWLSNIKLDWKSIHKIQSDALYVLLQKYAQLFTDGLGKLMGFKANIQVDPQVSPKFHKPCPTPYAYKPLVEEELERLSSLGIITPVQFVDWAAPIVPVLKRDKKSVHICGVYNVMVHQASRLK
uniref:CCHC-type domain-containing protein n=1 Tax=Amphimedon queenslandica TaxID=400682 RepID=A0A1X7TL57_AMPQE